MSNQIKDRLHAMVGFDPTGAIVASTAFVDSVVRTGPGVFEVTLAEGEGIPSNRESLGLLGIGFVGEGFTMGAVVVEKNTDTLYTIRSFDDLGAAADPETNIYFNVYVASHEPQ